MASSQVPASGAMCALHMYRLPTLQGDVTAPPPRRVKGEGQERITQSASLKDCIYVEEKKQEKTTLFAPEHER